MSREIGEDPMAAMDLIRKLTVMKKTKEVRTLDVSTLSQIEAEQLLRDVIAGRWCVESSNEDVFVISRPYIRPSTR